MPCLVKDNFSLYLHAMENSCSYLGMESQARDKTSHAVSEAASISLQCGIHLLQKEGELRDLSFFWQTGNITLTLPE